MKKYLSILLIAGALVVIPQVTHAGVLEDLYQQIAHLQQMILQLVMQKSKLSNSTPSIQNSGWQIYRNEKVGFQIDIPQGWKATFDDFTGSATAKTSGGVGFTVPRYPHNNLIGITIFTKSQWQILKDSVPATYIGENNRYVFAFSHILEVLPETEQEVDKISQARKTFKAFDITTPAGSLSLATDKITYFAGEVVKVNFSNGTKNNIYFSKDIACSGQAGIILESYENGSWAPAATANLRGHSLGPCLDDYGNIEADQKIQISSPYKLVPGYRYRFSLMTSESVNAGGIDEKTAQKIYTNEFKVNSDTASLRNFDATIVNDNHCGSVTVLKDANGKMYDIMGDRSLDLDSLKTLIGKTVSVKGYLYDTLYRGACSGEIPKSIFLISYQVK